MTVLGGTGEGWWRILSKPCDGAEELGAEDSQEDSLLMIGYWEGRVSFTDTVGAEELGAEDLKEDSVNSFNKEFELLLLMIEDSSLMVLHGTGGDWSRFLTKPCDGEELLGAEDWTGDSFFESFNNDCELLLQMIGD